MEAEYLLLLEGTKEAICSQSFLGEINIGPDSTGIGFQHWTEMTDNPESRIFKWHHSLSSD